MLVGSDSMSLGFFAFIKEPVINREASSYIMEHYGELIAIIRKQDIKEEKAQDLLHDVYISIVESEEDGNGFDMEFGSRVDENGNVDSNIMDVSQFVIGRIKLYAKNTKYRTDIIEGVHSTVTQTVVMLDTELDENGQEVLGKDGKVKTTKRVKNVKVPVIITTNAASFNDGGDVEENNDEFQKAFAVASRADSTDEVTELLSIREQIDYCIDVCSLHGVNLLNIFKNIDVLADMLGAYSRKKKTAEGVFSKLTELTEYHTELAENLIQVLRFSSSNKAAFNEIIATY